MAQSRVALRSPLTWIGGKHYLATRIVAAMPPDAAYDTYIEPFCGACHVLFGRPCPSPHVEIVNDRDDLLVNFLLCLRDQTEALYAKLAGLPYSRALYYRYHASLFASDAPAKLDPVERAARFFYVVRSSFNAIVQRTPRGWNVGVQPCSDRTRTFRSAIEMLPRVAERLKTIAIDNRDFAQVIALYTRPRTFFYCDPPYLGTEDYYQGGAGFGRADHERLATALAQAHQQGAQIALSYYECPELAEWYPAATWSRLSWDVPKHSQRAKAQKSRAREVLLCNYVVTPDLWTNENK
ncbi:MAG: DNA adenine methylase [Ktedonobacteraceae bacterium]